MLLQQGKEIFHDAINMQHYIMMHIIMHVCICVGDCIWHTFEYVYVCNRH